MICTQNLVSTLVCFFAEYPAGQQRFDFRDRETMLGDMLPIPIVPNQVADVDIGHAQILRSFIRHCMGMRAFRVHLMPV